MDKKANSTMILGIILIAVAAMIVGSFTIPELKKSTNQFDYSQAVTKTNASANQSFTLSTPATTDSLVSSSLSISGLTLTTNYTIDYTTKVLTLNDKTTNKTYTAVYKYTDTNYLTSTSDRGVYAIIALVFIIGIAFAVLRLFNIA